MATGSSKTMLSTMIVLGFLISFVCSADVPQQNLPNINANKFSTEMKDLNTTIYKEVYHKPINISVGEELTIVLPSFDSLFREEHFTFKILNEEENSNVLRSIEMNNNEDSDFSTEKDGDSQTDGGQSEQDKANTQQESKPLGEQVKLSSLPLKCSYVHPSASIYHTVEKIAEESGGTNKFSMQTKQYVHVASRQLIYILNPENMLLAVYYYNDVGIKSLASFQLPMNQQQSDQSSSDSAYQYSSQSHPSVAMATNSKETEVIIISDMNVFVIQTKTFLTNIKKYNMMSGINPVSTRGMDRLFHGVHNMFVGMKKMSRVYLIPEAFLNKNYTEITKFKNEHIFPQDIAVHGSYIYVLDVYKGVFIYKILADQTVEEQFKIDLNSFGGNYRLHVFQTDSIFVNFNDYDGSKVVELNVDMDEQKAYLVRYYKNDEFISYINTYSVLTSSTGFYLNEIDSVLGSAEGAQMNRQPFDTKQVMNSVENLLFMVTNYQEIQIFPFNVDPRTITSQFNGVKIPYSNVRDIIHIFGDRFLIMTEDTIDYVKISVFKPEVSCMIGRQYNRDYTKWSENMMVSVRSNISTCEYRNELLPHKNHYNENCELTTDYLVHVTDPESTTFKRILTYGIVVFVVVIFIIGLFCLIQWRNEKMIVLQRLRDQIMKFRARHRRMQPFVEEPALGNPQQVEMEVPADIEFIPNAQEEDRQ